MYIGFVRMCTCFVGVYCVSVSACEWLFARTMAGSECAYKLAGEPCERGGRKKRVKIANRTDSLCFPTFEKIDEKNSRIALCDLFCWEN